MANKVVNATQLDADLLSIADAIREKGGTSAALHFPEEFITAINDIHGGGGDAYAAISVTYPAGSVCTCTQAGQDTLTAGDTSGIWLFVVPVGGTWTVTATQGDRTISQMVSIGEYGQAEHITLQYELWLFKDGNEYPSITGGWVKKSGNATVTNNTTHLYILSNGSGGMAGTNKTIDLTNFTTLEIDCSMPNNYSGVTVGIIAEGTSQAAAYITPTTTRRVFAIDLTNITGNYYVYISSSSAYALSLFSVKLS